MTSSLKAILAVCFVVSCSTSTQKPADMDEPAPDTHVDVVSGHDVGSEPDSGEVAPVRVATFNASLFRGSSGELVRVLTSGDRQAQLVAQTVQRIRPDIVLLNEFDWDPDGEAAEVFAEEYLGVAQGDDAALEYPYRYVAESNTGESSGLDLDNSGDAVTDIGSTEYGNDSFGFGTFPGQYSMVIYSRFPIATDQIRTFRRFRWVDMPAGMMPTDFYSDEAANVFRLSSKNHIDVPIDVGGTTLHLLASHPTPVGFDGDEDRNGRRNHDEIRLWVDYVNGDDADYLVDDEGVSGGLEVGAAFVVVGDLNNDPIDGDSLKASIQTLLEIAQDPMPTSDGGPEAAERDGEANIQHEGDPALDTADFSDGVVGNTRVDYVLPARGLDVVGAGVFWPTEAEDSDGLLRASDHRLVWVDLAVPE